ncbi:protocatechuate 3,4-dioxygenase subunit alpha [Rhodopila sp.]|jgi:protocatechuate 3,4-dioxygenase alpha subunit|uniref:protocatechuate 3,4-dioxygenase subunit alpha n=1 Tax=Rhodopila sp. TaxID=2480087 RepID=UPI002C298453|nr:protocatechuate 3,4-dioxygenase subunit alpha [Rhodopila sp.]HVZ06419.1 protocatechuate 3,4-dioxygenase subunit alpha [Rhodopila sp.]
MAAPPLIATASQTIGPYWHLIEQPEMADLLRFGASGPAITVTGRITDGAGQPVTDAAVEIWQASPPVSDSFPAYGRCRTDADGRFSFRTLKPGPVPGLGNAQQAPHIAITILARGLLRGLTTRLYFRDEPLNDTDPVLSLIESPADRATLIAAPTGVDAWTLDIRLQGENETVFLDI